jgi:hypothetical protein
MKEMASVFENIRDELNARDLGEAPLVIFRFPTELDSATSIGRLQ